MFNFTREFPLYPTKFFYYRYCLKSCNKNIVTYNLCSLLYCKDTIHCKLFIVSEREMESSNVMSILSLLNDHI